MTAPHDLAREPAADLAVDPLLGPDRDPPTAPILTVDRSAAEDVLATYWRDRGVLDATQVAADSARVLAAAGLLAEPPAPTPTPTPSLGSPSAVAVAALRAAVDGARAEAAREAGPLPPSPRARARLDADAAVLERVAQFLELGDPAPLFPWLPEQWAAALRSRTTA